MAQQVKSTCFKSLIARSHSGVKRQLTPQSCKKPCTYASSNGSLKKKKNLQKINKLLAQKEAAVRLSSVIKNLGLSNTSSLQHATQIQPQQDHARSHTQGALEAKSSVSTKTLAMTSPRQPVTGKRSDHSELTASEVLSSDPALIRALEESPRDKSRTLNTVEI